ncbi:MAG: hypothetical protein K6T91_00155 [Firmicutes bacterium]|nr:hypothetical protein [Bacillota bacterium]
MSPMVEKFSLDEIENSLCQIDAVEAARIVVDSEQNIEEIHILADSSRGPKQLARDIESVLMAKYGLPVNHRKISIALINTQDARIASSRPKLTSVKHEIFGQKAQVTVTLEYGSNKYEGVELGPASRVGRLRLVALATIKAVEQLIPDSYCLSLEDITAISLGRDMAVIVSIAILSISEEETVIGCAFVKGDQRETIVKAVLDAVNRRLGILITA